MIAMILAAGRGERMRPITASLPKALVEVHGRSLLERHLDALSEAGIKNVVINLGWHGEQIAERIGSGANYGLSVAYSPEGDDILETGGGIHRALPLLGDDPFLVVNADVFTDMPLALTLDHDMLGHLVLVPKPEHKQRGDFGLEDGLLLNSGSRPYTFSGVAVYRPEFFADAEPGRFPLAPMLRSATEDRRLSASLYTGLWEDVGTPERLADLNRR